MQRFVSISFIILIAFSGLVAIPAGEQLLDELIGMINPKNSEAVMTQTIETTAGQTRTLTYKTHTANQGEKVLMRYLAPARVRGNALLMTDHSNNIWMYNRRTRRVRKLATHAKRQSFEGSDFTYEDLGSGDVWEKDYQPETDGIAAKRGQKCIKLVLKAKTEKVTYPKLICWLRNSDHFPIQIDYYNADEELLKSLSLKEIKEIEGVLTPMKMVMYNHQDNSQTSMAYENITYNVHFKANFFSERNLRH